MSNKDNNGEIDFSIYLQELDDDGKQKKKAAKTEKAVGNEKKSAAPNKTASTAKTAGEKKTGTAKAAGAKKTDGAKKPDSSKKTSDKRTAASPKKATSKSPKEAAVVKNASKEPEDIVSSTKKLPLKERLTNWWKREDNKGQKIAVIVAAVILIIVVVAGSILWSKLSLIDTNDDFTGSDEFLEDDINAESMDSITDAASLNDLLKKWATNGGEKLHSKHVKNVLLIGKDSTSSLSDSMILVSVNEKDKKISLVSFYRDSYIYIAPDGKKERFKKLNSAYSAGGAACLIETIENSYKIEIDDYVMVDYSTFPKIIDALGGVDVNVTSTEANYLNSTWRQWTMTGNKVSYTSGVNHLNGEKALMFCRIRKVDSDVGRTERQRRVITSIMNSFKNASLTQMNDAVNILLPNVKTGMSRTEILGFATDAVSSGWLSYPMAQTSMPTEDTSRNGSINGESVWIVDYEGAAYQLQMLLYGTSNIEMSDDRISAIDLKPTTNNQSTITTTTRPTTTVPGTTVVNRNETTTALNTDNTTLSDGEPTSSDGNQSTTDTDTTSTTDTSNSYTPGSIIEAIRDRYNQIGN